MSRKRGKKALSLQQYEAPMAEMLVVVAPCGARFTFPAAEALAASRAHQAECDVCAAIVYAEATGSKVRRA